jgi:hypothetical protein
VQASVLIAVLRGEKVVLHHRGPESTEEKILDAD